MKYGITQWSLPGHGMYAVKYAAEAGLDGLQIELGAYEDGYYMAQPKVYNDYLADGKKYGIEFPSIVLNCLSTHGFVGGADSEDYDIAIESLYMALDVVKAMNINMVMLPFFWANELKDEATTANAITVLKDYCRVAAEFGLEVATETTLSAEDQIKFLTAIDLPNVTTFFDTQNYRFFKGYDQKDTIEKLYPYISDQIHVKDGIGQEHKGGILSGSYLGQGDSDFQASVDKLKAESFDGWLILENYYYLRSFSGPSSGQFEALDKDVSYLKSLFA
jgi:sugar phosphate isomerase/epimerase